MKTKPEDLPVVIFDWLRQFDFGSLNQQQRAEVLQHVSEDEYTLLRDGALTIGTDSRPRRALGRKQVLMDHFDSVHAAPKVWLPAQVWKAAALFIFFGSGWLLHGMLSPMKHDVSAMAVHDTVYVTREVVQAPERIYDTVYLERPVETKTKHETIHGAEGNLIDYLPRYTVDLPFSEMDSLPNRQRHNSLKDDSLLRKFVFVTI